MKNGEKFFTIVGIISIFSLLLYVVNKNSYLKPTVLSSEDFIMNIFIIIVGALVIWVTVHDPKNN